jgi:hypothetical protein
MRLPLFAALLLSVPLAAQQPTPAAPTPPPAQPAFAADSAAVMGIVKNMFDGMRNRDTALMRAQFHPSATMRSAAYDRSGKAMIREDGPSSWITSIAGARPDLFIDERLGPPAVHVDGNLATVWVYYELWLGERFSHCGADVVTFGRTDAGWKVLFVADSRRSGANCTPHLAKGS